MNNNEIDNTIDNTEEDNSQEELNDTSDQDSVKTKGFEAILTNSDDTSKMMHLTGMYRNWFLDYASYVILERAVPHLYDGLKPVQRRILHAMWKLDDGRYNKVANIIGYTMQYHPHGDAAIQDALVQMGQKDLLIDTQGNWGNIFTGDSAAAARYIEARLTKFALHVCFNPKTTTWKLSYDGRNQEPVNLPVKFPLLLAQGSEGIAVGLASKILPHNFNELIDACIAYLRGRKFDLYPDFPTGGLMDVSRYNDAARGGSVKVRAKINIVDKKTLSITELPYGKTTSTLIDSILKVVEKGKIKIKKIDDNTAENVEILIHLMPDASIDKTIDALYAFTDCEINISANTCVVDNESPKFLSTSELLKASVDNTVKLLTLELQIEKEELEQQWHLSSLEKIFIENKIYNKLENCENWDAVYDTVSKALKPHLKNIKRPVTNDDINKLVELPFKRISKFDKKKADEFLKKTEAKIKEVKNKLANIIPYAIEYYQEIKNTYGKGRERKTEIRSFDTIQAAYVAAANVKLYVNRKEGFLGTDLRKDEFVCECSDIDDIIVFLQDGMYKIVKIPDKLFVGKDIIHVAVFRKNDERTIYNVIYRDGLNGAIMMKRCTVTGLMRDKEYFITKGTKGSKILYFTANPNGEAEKLKVFLKPRPRLKSLTFNFDFSQVPIKGRNSIGSILSRFAIHKIEVTEKLGSTLGGEKRWFDEEVKRLNADERGKYIGEFFLEDKILVIDRNGHFRLTNFDITNHYQDDIMIIEKYNPKKIFSAAFYDGDQKNFYIKRFQIEPVEKKTSLIGEHEKSKLLWLSQAEEPVIEVYAAGDTKKKPEKIVVKEFVELRNMRAKGNKIGYKVKKIVELETSSKENTTNEEKTNATILKPKIEIKAEKAQQMKMF